MLLGGLPLSELEAEATQVERWVSGCALQGEVALPPALPAVPPEPIFPPFPAVSLAPAAAARAACPLVSVAPLVPAVRSAPPLAVVPPPPAISALPASPLWPELPALGAASTLPPPRSSPASGCLGVVSAPDPPPDGGSSVRANLDNGSSVPLYTSQAAPPTQPAVRISNGRDTPRKIPTCREGSGPGRAWSCKERAYKCKNRVPPECGHRNSARAQRSVDVRARLPPLKGLEKLRFVAWGELLWDVFPDRARLGGAPGNAAYHAACLGADSALVSRVGNDESGARALNQLAQGGVDVAPVQLDLRAPTGTVAVTLHAGEPSYRDRRRRWPGIESLRAADSLAQRFSTADVICFPGTLAQRAPGNLDVLQRALALVSVACAAAV